MRSIIICAALLASLAAASPRLFGYEMPEAPAPEPTEPEQEQWIPTCGTCPKDHHCLMIPNGYPTCVWEGYHTRERCNASGEILWKRELANPRLMSRPDPYQEALSSIVKLGGPQASEASAEVSAAEASAAMSMTTTPATLEPRHLYDMYSPIINCEGKYDVCAEYWPPDGRKWGHCIEKAHWMMWDVCREPRYGRKMGFLKKIWHNFIVPILRKGKPDPCDPQQAQATR